MGIDIQEYKAYKRNAMTTAVVILGFISDVTAGIFLRLLTPLGCIYERSLNESSKFLVLSIII